MYKISVILPVYSYDDPLLEVINSLKLQKYKPFEIIIIDSSNNIKIQELIKEFEADIKILYHWVPKAYPGHARNIGVKLSKGEYVAFVDSKTIPKKNWLFDNIEIIKKNKLDYKIGLTEFIPKTFTQKIINASTYGKLSFSTIPGSIFNKNFFEDSGGFVNNLRSGEDQHFLLKIRYFQEIYNNQAYLTYQHLPTSLLTIINRYFVYSFYTCFSNIQIFTKNIYLIFFLMLTAVIFTNIKSILPDTYNYLKNYYTFFYYLITYLIFYNFMPILYYEMRNKLFYYKLFIIIFFIFLCILIYNWNMYFANWIETSNMYIPHITKIFISIVILFSVVIRGLLLPLYKKVSLKFIFPVNWIIVGGITFIIDIVKSPSYILGAIIYPFIQIYYYIKDK